MSAGSPVVANRMQIGGQLSLGPPCQDLDVGLAHTESRLARQLLSRLTFLIVLVFLEACLNTSRLSGRGPIATCQTRPSHAYDLGVCTGANAHGIGAKPPAAERADLLVGLRPIAIQWLVKRLSAGMPGRHRYPSLASFWCVPRSAFWSVLISTPALYVALPVTSPGDAPWGAARRRFANPASPRTRCSNKRLNNWRRLCLLTSDKPVKPSARRRQDAACDAVADPVSRYRPRMLRWPTLHKQSAQPCIER